MKKLLKLIMIEQTLFALPFAYLGTLFAGGDEIIIWLLVTVALFSARTAGMSFNRAIDADIDSRNPRTNERLLPKGEISKKVVWIFGIISSLIFIYSSYIINELCFHLSFAALFMLFTYSYFKRFSSTSHFYLGFIEAAAPVGGYLAVTGRFDIIPFILGAAIFFWITGLDIVYAIQDVEFDKEEGLFSIPARFGIEKALIVSSILYFLSLAALILAGMITNRGTTYWVAVICVALIFFRQQVLANGKDKKTTIAEFFQINTFISPILFIGTFIDVMSQYWQ